MDNQVAFTWITSDINLLSILLSGVLGALLGSIISAVVALKISKKQMELQSRISARQMLFQSNRVFLEKLILELQTIFTSINTRDEISDNSIKEIDAFQVVCYEELKVIDNDLNSLKDAIFKYREGRSESLALASTTASQKEIHARKNILDLIFTIMNKMRSVT